MLCVLRWWRRLRAGLDDDRRGWPPLDPGLTVPRIDGQRASACLECDRGHTYRSGCVERLQLSTGQADELAEDDTTRYGYTPPEPGMVDRSGLSIDPW